MGDGLQSNEVATHALVFMVVAVNSTWKLPFAHFFTKTATSEDLANLVRLAIVYLNETGAVLMSLTMDNAATNIAMLHKIGASVSNVNSIKCSTQEKNILGVPILVILDPCHLLKLVRGALHDCQVIYSTSSSPAQWSHIRELHELQSTEGIHLANKLTASHVYFSGQKMKVCLAAQVCSNSVADALEYAQFKIKRSGFEDTSGTCQYLRTFNVLFDRMNCKSTRGNCTKSPINCRVIEEVKVDFAKCEAYIKSLTHEDEDVTGEPSTKRCRRSIQVVCGSRKRGFVGFLVNMKTFIKLYEIYIQTGYLKYLLAYKYSQDHVELLFCTVRGSLGKNNNPTTNEFSRSMKMILIGASHSSRYSNCTLQDDTSLLLLPTKLEDAVEVCRSEYDLLSEVEGQDWIDEYIVSSIQRTEYKDDCLVYIAGYIQKTLIKKEKCEDCKGKISNLKIVETSDLINIKNRGPLFIPSTEFVTVVRVAHSLYETRMMEPSLYTEKNLMERLVIRLSRIFTSTKPNLFKFLNSHDQSMTTSHASLMIRKIGCLVFTIFLHHHCKTLNSKEAKIRPKFSKLILFKNQ